MEKGWLKLQKQDSKNMRNKDSFNNFQDDLYERPEANISCQNLYYYGSEILLEKLNWELVKIHFHRKFKTVTESYILQLTM